MAFLVNGNPIVTDARNLSEVGIATINEDINVGRLLYDSNGNVGGGNSVLVTKDNTLQWVNPSFIGISTGMHSLPVVLILLLRMEATLTQVTLLMILGNS